MADYLTKSAKQVNAKVVIIADLACPRLSALTLAALQQHQSLSSQQSSPMGHWNPSCHTCPWSLSLSVLSGGSELDSELSNWI